MIDKIGHASGYKVYPMLQGWWWEAWYNGNSANGREDDEATARFEAQSALSGLHGAFG